VLRPAARVGAEARDGMSEIRPATTAAEIAAVQALFHEYAGTLDVDLGYQGFANEVAALPGDYAPPRGALLLAGDAAAPLGCVALRPLDWPHAAELKRLYVAPAGRGRGLGVRLTKAALAIATSIGYERICLDTLPSMAAAQRLYESLGFRDVAPYRFSPVPGTRYMERSLGRAR